MSALVPHDPRAPRVSPEELSRRVEETLGAEEPTLREELEQLNRAHDLLNDALQDR
ncbi:hypothetical protein [uncultured Corynebacterium sp.]|uniref:hypothetical protein n=1 Tax=uncultured Corynebacterium sp. TaxID=159447 RepID=UPI002596C6DF|nr:hypothetical protein [uncultured Corynebacterium sp.]